LIFESTKPSGAPNPASAPVSGWIQPMVIFPVEDPAVELEVEPLMLELQA
jgi:hypothetical protein